MKVLVAKQQYQIGMDDSWFKVKELDTTHHIIIGLKSGSLLSKQLVDEEVLQADLATPMFSPELQIWRTPLKENC